MLEARGGGDIVEEWPPVSIVIPTYNRAHLLCESLGSVLKTNYPNFEVVLVVNGCTDDTINIARAIALRDQRLRIISISNNIEFAGAINLGVSHAAGEYIAVICDDETVNLEWLMELMKVMVLEIQVWL